MASAGTDSVGLSSERAVASDGRAVVPELRWLTSSAVVRVLPLLAVALFLLLPLRTELRIPYPTMEEGFMLSLPYRVLHGAIPNRDFGYFYGPGSLWLPAGFYAVFGNTILVERLVAFLYQAALVLALFSIARAWGRSVATATALIATAILVPLGLMALPWEGAVASALWGLVTLGAARRSADATRAARLAMLGGVLGGVALLLRPDLLVAVVASGVVFAATLPRRPRRALAAGLGIGLSPYLLHLATAGVGTCIRAFLLDPLRLRSERHLPIPPQSALLTRWFILVLLAVTALVIVGVWQRSTGRVELLAVGVFSVGLVPEMLQRLDFFHIGFAACVPVAMLPVAIAAAVRGLEARERVGAARVARDLVASASALVALLVLAGGFTMGRTTNHVLAAVGPDLGSHPVTSRGRTFYLQSEEDATAVGQVIADVRRVSRPGARLFVGPLDLRMTLYNEAELYYLLPEFVPATYFIDMHPDVALRQGTRLARDVAGADVLILSPEVWMIEPASDPGRVGSNAANLIVARDFCPLSTHSKYQVLIKCRTVPKG